MRFTPLWTDSSSHSKDGRERPVPAAQFCQDLYVLIQARGLHPPNRIQVQKRSRLMVAGIGLFVAAFVAFAFLKVRHKRKAVGVPVQR
jgi:hypothetical protein